MTVPLLNNPLEKVYYTKKRKVIVKHIIANKNIVIKRYVKKDKDNIDIKEK